MIRGQSSELQLESLESRVLLSIGAEEQLFVYLLNLARSDPEGYATEEGFTESLAGIAPQPPLAVNDLLFDSAGFHAEEMADNDYFGHTSQVTGDQPNKMAIDAGYPLPWDSNGNQIESIGAGYGNPPVGVAPTDAPKALQLLLEDIGLITPGHRIHLLGMSGWQSHRDIGAGYGFNNSSTLKNYWSIHTAYENTSDLFLTGVAYNDNNNNDRYDLNEGLAGVTITTTAGTTQTNAQGGWSLPITDGDYTVTATGGSFDGTGSILVRVDGANMEIDFISGDTAGVANFGINGGSGIPEVSVTATDDQAAEAGLDPGTFTFTRTGSMDAAMTVNYTVTGSATSGSDYQAIASSVIIPIGQSSATVIVTPIDDNDTEGRETVLVTLQTSQDFNLGSSTLATVNISDDEGVVVDFGDGIAKSVIFTEADNTTGTISVKSATGSIKFEGDNLTTSQQKTSIVVSGAASIADITLENTSAATSLSAKASGIDGYILVNNININGSAKDIKGKVIDLGGNLTVEGGLAKLEFHDVADQHLINIGQSAAVPGPVSIKFNEVANLSIDSETAIKSLSFLNWVDDDLTIDMIEAPWIGKISAKQDFSTFMNLTDDSVKFTLGPVKVGNAITGGGWLVNGHGGKVSANSITGIWAAAYIGDLAGLATKQDATGNLTANTIKSVSVKGNYTISTITLSQSADPNMIALAKLNVSGTMDTVNIRSQSGLGAITAGRILNSNIFAGIDNAVTQLPTAANDFSATAAIKSVKLKGIAGQVIWLQNSNIAAAELGKVAVGFAQTDNSDVQFGIATQQFGSIAYKDATNNLKASSQADLAGFAGLDDLVIRIL
jgi:Calx-beta domain-containing protein